MKNVLKHYQMTHNAIVTVYITTASKSGTHSSFNIAVML